MMITIENESLRALIHPLGAELRSLYHKKHSLEYLWNGNPEYWPRVSPVLFPIVGGLKEDSYIYQGKTYMLPKHGFARDTQFIGKKTGDHKATFTLSSNSETRASYPFDFIFQLHYELTGETIRVTYQVTNPARETMYFSVGAHPAFAVPLVENTKYEDYYLQFSQPETLRQWPVDGNLLELETVPFLENEGQIPLKQELFYNDAIIFKNPASESISLLSSKTPHGINFHFEGFPFMGIWAAKDASFVCIEPWCGIPDLVNHNQQINQKEGIIALGGQEQWQRSWAVDCL